MQDFERLRLMRKESGFEKDRFAEILGYKPRTYANFENGTDKITDFFLEKLQKTVNGNPDYILKGEMPVFKTKISGVMEGNYNAYESVNQNNNSKYDELMTPERFERLLTLMERQQNTIDSLIENQKVLSLKIPDVPGGEKYARAAMR